MASLADVRDAVLLATEAIPAGQVASYGDVGRVVGCGPRLVARVLASCGDEVSWWRVLRADGTIAPGLVSEASQLLVAEGVSVRDGRVDLARHRAVLD